MLSPNIPCVFHMLKSLWAYARAEVTNTFQPTENTWNSHSKAPIMNIEEGTRGAKRKI